MTPATLTQARDSLGWTQQELADELRVDKMTVWRWENDQRPMPAWLDGDVARVVLRLERELRRSE